LRRPVAPYHRRIKRTGREESEVHVLVPMLRNTASISTVSPTRIVMGTPLTTMDAASPGKRFCGRVAGGLLTGCGLGAARAIRTGTKETSGSATLSGIGDGNLLTDVALTVLDGFTFRWLLRGAGDKGGMEAGATLRLLTTGGSGGGGSCGGTSRGAADRRGGAGNGGRALDGGTGVTTSNRLSVGTPDLAGGESGGEGGKSANKGGVSGAAAASGSVTGRVLSARSPSASTTVRRSVHSPRALEGTRQVARTVW
jgi:hypothetical protein